MRRDLADAMVILLLSQQNNLVSHNDAGETSGLCDSRSGDSLYLNELDCQMGVGDRGWGCVLRVMGAMSTLFLVALLMVGICPSRAWFGLMVFWKRIMLSWFFRRVGLGAIREDVGGNTPRRAVGGVRARG